MKKYIIAFLISYIFLLLPGEASFAQDKGGIILNDSLVTEDNSDPVTDSVIIQGDTVLKSFTFTLSYDSLNAYKSDKDFQYIAHLDSLLRQVQQSDTSGNADRKSSHKYKRSESSVPATDNTIFNSPFIKIFFWMLAVGFIGFILYRLFLTESIFRKDPRKGVAAVQQDEMVIKPAVFDLLIYDAVINKDLRLAIRYLYLQALQQLAEKGLIQLSADKTNNDYVKELSGTVHQQDFAGITRNYEYVWYGRFDVDPEIFTKIRKGFKQYYQRL